ncbi:MAG TPA: hypothetical protein DC000_05055 [Clostridiales bacterium]|nr:hypothetical protein [Clostridiales bacterium]
MKNYFNAAERNNHLLLMALWNMLEDKLETNNSCYSNEENKYIKYARTYLLKLNNSILVRMDDKYCKQLIKDLKDLIVIAESKSSFKVTKKDQDKNYITLKLDEYYTLCDCACHNCKNCTIKNYGECGVYEFFIAHQVPVANEHAKNACPYKPPKNEIKDIDKNVIKARKIIDESEEKLNV